MKNTSVNELMPREKALEYGISSLNNTELLALILKTACVDKSVFEMADEVIDLANGFSNLLTLTYEELTTIKGIKKAKAMELLAILEISKRLSKVDQINETQMDKPGKVVEWLRFSLGYSTEEQFFVVYLDTKGVIKKAELMFKGSSKASTVGIDQVLRKAILLKASMILVAHNHPSNDVNPSPADIDLTNRLYKASLLMGIPLIDHIIIGKSDYYSFKNHGMLQ